MGQVTPYLFPGVGMYRAATVKDAKTWRPGGDDIERDRPSTYAMRGSIVPLLVGHSRVGGIICWVGDRKTESQVVAVTRTTSGKGASKKRSKATTQPIFKESAWHCLVVGPARRLHRIWNNGRQVFGSEVGLGPIDSVSDPSGSSFQDVDGNTFTIFWGERDQPINTFLGDASRVGISSRWPNYCYIVWTDFNLGPQAQWHLIDYDIEVAVEPTLRVDPLLECTEPDFGNGAGGYMVLAADPSFNGGYNEYNPIHVIDRLLFEEWPQGIGLDTTHVYRSAFESLAVLMQDEGQFCSILASNGESVAEIIIQILQDISAFVTWQVRLSLTEDLHGLEFIALRDPTGGPTPPTIPGAALMEDEAPEIEVLIGERAVSQVVWQYRDRDISYMDQTITVHEDGQGSIIEHAKAQKVGMPTVTSFDQASKVAERRSQEVLPTVASYHFKATKASRYLTPGRVAFLEGIEEALRIVAVKVAQLTSVVEVDAVVDVHGVEASTFAPEDHGTGASGASPAVEDLQKVLKELPAELASVNGIGKTYLYVPRIRANDQQGGAEMWVSRDNVGYAPNSFTAEAHAGGTLDEDLLESAQWEIDQGPEFTILGPDIGDVLDLSSASDEHIWRSGRQLCLINDELFFLRKVTAIGPTTYRLDGLIRARYNTRRADHAIGDVVFIFTDDVHILEDPIFVPDEDVYVKPRTTAGGVLALASVTPVSILPLYGRGVRPEAPVGLRTLLPIPNVGTYTTGQAVRMRWEFFWWSVPGVGAGSFGAGQPVPVAYLPAGSSFFLRIYDPTGVTVLRTVQLTNNGTFNNQEFNYTNGMILSDHGGGEDSFWADVTLKYGLESEISDRLFVEYVP